MQDNYKQVFTNLKEKKPTWLITGVAGFIGSNILEALLSIDQNVTGLDNFSTGFKENLYQVKESVTFEQWKRFKLLEGDISSAKDCKAACKGSDYILHQAALGSVTRSIEDPLGMNRSNVDGFLNILVAAKEEKVKTFVFASSSSVYGDYEELPKVEAKIGMPLSPYAASKQFNEIYASVFKKIYGLNFVALRYFNVFGKRQNPQGMYAAVIPLWVDMMYQNKNIFIFGDGKTSRDFCYIENVVQANILSAVYESKEIKDNIFNIAVGRQTTLLELFDKIRHAFSLQGIKYEKAPTFLDERIGDVKHSWADIKNAETNLKYEAKYDLETGLNEYVSWYVKQKKL